MKLATKNLLGAIQQGQVKASSFTSTQLQQISAGAKKIDGKNGTDLFNFEVKNQSVPSLLSCLSP
ncbi:hypothetical protein [Pseudomonas corrugata]|uniref:hypothetical protein n=1 Tax=Pseudomonas corrugata TaxID=47879 RepID=UPI0029FF39DF|nr:hypothetical protein [Pseudomonas corrugata]